uniref:Uncharacterized protein n=1 Tax=Lygus hesperus TaxID=30085 RepID=A0A0A9XVN8_LYGHE
MKKLVNRIKIPTDKSDSPNTLDSRTQGDATTIANSSKKYVVPVSDLRLPEEIDSENVLLRGLYSDTVVQDIAVAIGAQKPPNQTRGGGRTRVGVQVYRRKQPSIDVKDLLGRAHSRAKLLPLRSDVRNK